MNYYEIWRLPQVKHNSKSKITKTKRQNGKSQNWFRKPSLLLAFSPLCTVKVVHINICLIRRWLDTTSNLLTTFYLRGFFVVAELKKVSDEDFRCKICHYLFPLMFFGILILKMVKISTVRIEVSIQTIDR